MHELVEELFKREFSNQTLNELSDSAIIKSLPLRDADFCFTTDSYVVTPIFFPGGDIGKLAVCGTINDLAVVGAKPLYLSAGFIIEEGLEYKILEQVTQSMADTARKEGVTIVTGDTKVVEKKGLDKLFISTSGIGIKDKKLNFSTSSITPGDKIIINGSIAEHGLAVLTARGRFDFQTKIESDCAGLGGLIEKIISQESSGIKFMRDPTRGGVAATLNEIVKDKDFGINIFEDQIPLKEEAKALCEILGFDPLYIANEGKVVVVVSKQGSETILELMQQHPLGKDSRIIGEVTEDSTGKVTMKTSPGGSRIIDMPVAEQLPRIC